LPTTGGLNLGLQPGSKSLDLFSGIHCEGGKSGLGGGQTSVLHLSIDCGVRRHTKCQHQRPQRQPLD
jgi:hypothetical protein